MKKRGKAILTLCALSVVWGMSGCSTVSSTKVSELVAPGLAVGGGTIGAGAAKNESDGTRLAATAGGGVVTASVSGKRELTALEIDPDAVDPEDVEMLQDMVIAAVNEALRKAEDAANQNMSKFTGGLNLGF